MILARDRHQLAPLLFGGRVERNGEFRPHRRRAEFGNAGDDSGGGNGEAPLEHAHAFGVGENAGCFEHVGEIQERLALAHHDDVHLPFTRVQAVQAGQYQHLAHDFRRAEAALESHERGEAELAIHRAADLRRDAERVAAFVGHVDGFHGAPVGEPQQVSPCAVRRRVLFLELGEPEIDARGEVPPQGGGQRRHPVKRGNALLVERTINLAGPVCRLVRAEQFGDVGSVHPDQRHTAPV